jgi:tRNA G18 (ribose-2'-O)-methylase SpoU
VPDERLGRNLYCPDCGLRMTARPASVEHRLRETGAVQCQAAPVPVARLPLAVVVDNVRSLWNVGSIFRTADACGVSELWLCGITGRPPRPEIAKTALGAERAVSWSWRPDPRGAIDELVARGFVPVVLERSEDAPAVDRLRWPERPCLVVGNEVAGVGPRTIEACHLSASIPMLGVKESLNVAVAFGIAAFAASRALAARARDTERPA